MKHKIFQEELKHVILRGFKNYSVFLYLMSTYGKGKFERFSDKTFEVAIIFHL